MLTIFSVYDSKAEAHLQPFFSVNRVVAIRDFSTAALDPNTAFSRNGADYTLFEIGEWDPSRGSITCYETKMPLGTALELAKQNNGGNV